MIKPTAPSLTLSNIQRVLSQRVSCICPTRQLLCCCLNLREHMIIINEPVIVSRAFKDVQQIKNLLPEKKNHFYAVLVDISVKRGQPRECVLGRFITSSNIDHNFMSPRIVKAIQRNQKLLNEVERFRPCRYFRFKTYQFGVIQLNDTIFPSNVSIMLSLPIAEPPSSTDSAYRANSLHPGSCTLRRPPSEQQDDQSSYTEGSGRRHNNFPNGSAFNTNFARPHTKLPPDELQLNFYTPNFAKPPNTGLKPQKTISRPTSPVWASEFRLEAAA